MPPKKIKFHLLGEEIQNIPTTSLPSNREVLNLFCHHHLTLKKKDRNAANCVILKVVEIYREMSVPMISSQNAENKILKLHEDWIKMTKNKSRATQVQDQREQLIVNLDQVFNLVP